MWLSDNEIVHVITSNSERWSEIKWKGKTHDRICTVLLNEKEPAIDENGLIKRMFRIEGEAESSSPSPASQMFHSRLSSRIW